MAKRTSERPRRKLKPITERPARSQFINALNLNELAFVSGKRHQRAYTTAQISGAIRALELRNNDTKNTVNLRGVVIGRQQTCVLVTMLPTIEEYLEENYGT
jgi:hypothetical protein